MLLFPLVAWAGPAEEMASWTARMEAAATALQDATFTFYKVELVGGSYVREENVLVRYRRPFDLYMKWTEGSSAGRQLLYKQGWNNDKMQVALGGWKPTLDLDPRGRLAKRNNRHNIFHIGFDFTTHRTAEDVRRLAARGLTAEVTDLGVQQVHGEPAQCYEAILPRTTITELYADKVEICANLRTTLPARVKAWENQAGAYVLLESYEHANIQVDTGLSDADFDPKAHGF